MPCRKIEIAWGAVSLVKQHLFEADAHSVGLIGHVHFVRYLFQWTLSTLTRTPEGAKPPQRGSNDAELDKESDALRQAGTRKRKSAVQPVDSLRIVVSKTQAPRNEGPAHVLDLRLWGLLRACLLSRELGSDAPINAALLQVGVDSYKESFYGWRSS